MTAPAAARAEDWRTIDWPAKVHRASVLGTEINYAELGSGEPAILLVHGLGAEWRVWLQNIAPLASVGRVIAPDLPGFGASPPVPGGGTVPELAKALEELCEQLNLGPVIAVGSSLGGCVAAELALAHPDRVEQLVLVDAVGVSPTLAERARTLPFIWAGTLFGKQVHESSEQIAARPGLRKAVLGRLVHDPAGLDPDLVRQALLNPPGRATREAIGAGLEHLTPDNEARLERIACPTLVIWGEQDQLLPLRHADVFRRRIPRARLITFERCGHVPMVEHPDLFNATVLDAIGK